MSQHVHSAEFKARGDFKAALHGVKDFFRQIQRNREYEAAEKQRKKQERNRQSKTTSGSKYGHRGGYFPYSSQKEGKRQ